MNRLSISVVFLFFTVFSGCSVITATDDKFVLTGEVNVVEGKATFTDKWRQVTNAGQSAEKEGTEIEVNIINCAGYLASAKVVYIWQKKWEMQVIAETIAEDAAGKIKLCKSSSTAVSDSGTAFAVIKPTGKTKNFKLENPDLRKVFSSLPSAVQSWANCEESLMPEDCVRKEKNILSRQVGDDWADTDGNGEVDFVIVSGNCNKTGDYTCSKYLKRTVLGWLEIASSQPA